MPIVGRIQTLAKASNQTLSGIERVLGFGNGSIRKWNVNSPSAEKLQKIADHFNVSVDYLLGRTDNAAPPYKTAIGTNRDGVIEDLSDDERIALLAFLALYREQKKNI